MKKMFKAIQNYLEEYGKHRTRHVLLSMSDKQLHDVGISRDLLIKGVQAWPWRMSDTTAGQTVTPISKPEIKQAVRELQDMSDRELLDMGLSRGEIKHAVVYGTDRQAA